MWTPRVGTQDGGAAQRCRPAAPFLLVWTPVYEKQGPKRCIASPGGPRRVQTYPGLSSTTRVPFSPDTGKWNLAAAKWKSQGNSTEDPVPDAQSISTENLIADLRDGGHAVPPAVTFDKFTDMDSALDVCADLTDEEIVRQVLEPDSESDSEDDAPAIVRPSNAELTQALM
ncbi:hypothetical protein HPB47_015006, partial [Ixodes persulcatus]